MEVGWSRHGQGWQDRPLEFVEVEHPDAFVDDNVTVGEAVEVCATEHDHLVVVQRKDRVKLASSREI